MAQQQGAGGYDFSLAGADSQAASNTSPYSSTDNSINSGAGRLIKGITFAQVLLFGVIALVALRLVIGRR